MTTTQSQPDYDEGLAAEPEHIQSKLIIGYGSGVLGTVILTVLALPSVTNGHFVGVFGALCLAAFALIIGTDAGRKRV